MSEDGALVRPHGQRFLAALPPETSAPLSPSRETAGADTQRLDAANCPSPTWLSLPRMTMLAPLRRVVVVVPG
jgi:hypothetical protein